MATYAINTTADQDAVLPTMLAKENGARASQSPPAPALTVDEYVQVLFNTLMAPEVRLKLLNEAAPLTQAYLSADAAGRAQLLASASATPVAAPKSP